MRSRSITGLDHPLSVLPPLLLLIPSLLDGCSVPNSSLCLRTSNFSLSLKPFYQFTNPGARTAGWGGGVRTGELIFYSYNLLYRTKALVTGVQMMSSRLYFLLFLSGYVCLFFCFVFFFSPM